MPLNVDLVRTTEADFAKLWSALEPTIRAGDAFTIPADYTESQARAWWTSKPHTFAAYDGADVVGGYFFVANQLGAGSHVANATYVVAPQARGRGVAKAMCQHSLSEARATGFRAMQFNIVVSTNEPAVRAWKACGFEIVGTLPGAFKHPSAGYVDAYVMYQTL
jgi:ribosomal protein S18 acetylase RimI-like enzyme